MDKADWHELIDSNYQIPDTVSVETLTDELLDYLHSPDAELRDTIAYNLFARWIISHRYYADEQLIVLVERLIPKMSDNLGNQNDDTVFGRSYSTLVLSLLAYENDRSNFMTEALTHSLLNQARNYLITERDLRAYVTDKGWANACAHTADLLRFLARSPYLRSEDAKRILDSIAEKVIMTSTYIYHHDEDERLAQVVLAVFDLSLLTTSELDNWLKHFRDWKASHTLEEDYNPTYHATYQNIKNFLRSLYINMQLVDSIPVDVADLEPSLLDVISLFSL